MRALLFKAAMRQFQNAQLYEVPWWNYQGNELKPDPSIRPERMRAYSLPSRVCDWLYFPDGRKEPFPGSAADEQTQSHQKQ